MVVLDRSGSMNSDTDTDSSSNKWNGAKDGAKLLIDSLGPGAQVGLVSYAGTAALDAPLGTAPATITDPNGTIDGLSTGGNTNIEDAIQTAQAELTGSNGRSGARKIMVVLTNGSPTAGGDPRTAATAAKNDGTEIYGIAYGSGANQNVIEDISSAPKADDGTIDELDEFAFLSSDISDVENVFSQIAQEIAGEIVIWQGSLAGLVADLNNFGLNAVPLDGAPERNFALQQGTAVDAFDAGVQCLAFEWYLPCDLTELEALGSSYSLTDEEGTPTSDVAGTMFDELVARGVIAADGSDFDINRLQTDTLEFGARFAAVQSRHNMRNESPFAETGSGSD
jgi:hypothetical protein